MKQLFLTLFLIFPPAILAGETKSSSCSVGGQQVSLESILTTKRKSDFLSVSEEKISQNDEQCLISRTITVDESLFLEAANNAYQMHGLDQDSVLSISSNIMFNDESLKASIVHNAIVSLRKRKLDPKDFVISQTYIFNKGTIPPIKHEFNLRNHVL